MSPISFDGDDVTGITIDGEEVTEVTMDGDVVWSSAAAPGVTVIDSFEDQDYAEWHGSLSNHGFDTAVAYDGAVSAVTSGDTTRTISSWPGGQTEDLPAYPSRGDVVSWFVRTDAPNAFQSDLIYFLNPANTDEYYEAFLRGWGTNSRIILRMHDSTGFTEFGWQNVTFPANTWMEVIVDTSETATDTMTLTVIDTSDGTQIGQVSGADGTFTDGGVQLGFNATAPATVWYDYIHIH